MNTDGIASRLFAVVKPQTTVEQVRVWARHHLIKGEAMLYAAGQLVSLAIGFRCQRTR